MVLQLNGFHHVTAISGDIRKNFRFMTQTLGMRLIKRSVNQDHTNCWHLFYGDGGAQAGSTLSFFDWPGTQGSPGSGVISVIGLRISPDSLDYWQGRLRQQADDAQVTLARQAGCDVIDLIQPDGLRLQLVADADDQRAVLPWAESPVPPAHQIRGLAHQTLTVHDRRKSEALLIDVLNMDYASDAPAARADDGNLHIYRMDAAGSLGEIHLIERPDLPVAEISGGSTHHMAMSTPDQASMDAWQAQLLDFGIKASDQIDRHYFRSLYFREPGGVLLEIATHGPGYTVDEPLDGLGRTMALPPFLEARRAEIEARVKPFD